MRDAMLVMGGFVVAVTFVLMYRAIWSAHSNTGRVSGYQQPVASELIWATIPLLMLLAAAFPAVLAVISHGRH
jgi:hypothetical protein